jgi:phosphopantothenoylcysteine synthetase/decarboxylase
MLRQISDLQAILSQLAVEHRKLLDQLDAQHAAMKKFDLSVMADVVTRCQAARLRINELEIKRRGVMRQITVALKLNEEPKLTKLAQLFPPQAAGLLKARGELRDVAAQIARRTQGSARLASAVLGHLNTVVRLFAGAVERAGLYTRQGIPRVASRIGVMDAVG